MDVLLLTGAWLFAAAWLYTKWLQKKQRSYEPDDTHWAAAGGIALIQVAYFVLCLAGPLPYVGDLTVESWAVHVALCWIAFIPVLRWRGREKRQQRAKRGN
jgi:Flp pilus assembly protein TadB